MCGPVLLCFHDCYLGDAECSDFNHRCCNGCSFEKKGQECDSAHPLSCSYSSYCSGSSGKCPAGKPKPDKAKCYNHGQCERGQLVMTFHSPKIRRIKSQYVDKADGTFVLICIMKTVSFYFVLWNTSRYHFNRPHFQPFAVSFYGSFEQSHFHLIKFKLQ